MLTYYTAAAALDAAKQAATQTHSSASLQMLDTTVKNFADSCPNFSDSALRKSMYGRRQPVSIDREPAGCHTDGDRGDAERPSRRSYAKSPRQRSGVPTTEVFRITQPFMRSATAAVGTVAVTGTEIGTNIATTVATLTVNWQQTHSCPRRASCDRGWDPAFLSDQRRHPDAVAGLASRARQAHQLASRPSSFAVSNIVRD